VWQLPACLQIQRALRLSLEVFAVIQHDFLMIQHDSTFLSIRQAEERLNSEQEELSALQAELIDAEASAWCEADKFREMKPGK